MSFIDIHSHLADPRFDSEPDVRLEQVIAEAKQSGISTFVQGGVGPEDWARQESLAKIHSEIIPVFGLHPYWVSAHTADECEQALDVLAQKLKTAVAVGEMGLDLRSPYKNCEGLQLEIFERQLELAKFANKPVVLHLVRAHEEALRVLNLFGLPDAGGFVHSFNGSLKKANDFMSLNLSISVGGALCRGNNKVLQQAVAQIPLEYLLLESDSPDQPPENWPMPLNHPKSILLVAEKMAQLKGIKSREVLDRTSQNARKLLAL